MADFWTGLAEYKRKKKEAEDEAKKDENQGSSFWADFTEWKRTGENKKFADALLEPEPEPERKSLSEIHEDRIAGAGDEASAWQAETKVEEPKTDARKYGQLADWRGTTDPAMPEIAATEPKTFDRSGLQSPAPRGTRGTGSGTSGIRSTFGENEMARIEADRQERMAEKTYLDATLRNQEWLDSLRPVEEIEAELEEARKANNQAGAASWLENAWNALVGNYEAANVLPESNKPREAQNAKAESEGRVKELEDELATAMWAKYESQRYKADFDEKSGYSENLSTWNGRTGDPLYEYVNGKIDAYTMMEAEKAQNSRRQTYTDTERYLHGQDELVAGFMTDDQIRLFNYLYATQGKTAAEEYFDYIRSDLNALAAETEKENIRKWTNQNGWTRVIASAYSVLSVPFRGLSYIGQAEDLLVNGKIDENAPYNSWANTASTIREAVSEVAADKWGKWGSFGYQTAMSMADFLFLNAVTFGINPGSEAAAVASSIMSLGMMGTGAAAEATMSAKRRGLDDTRAFVIGTIAGAAEVLSEKVSIEKLFRAANWDKEPVKYILQNFVFEGAEEVESDAINWLADAIVARDKSEWSEDIKEYQKANPGASEDEAFWNAIVKRAEEGFYDFLGGAISGGIMAGGRVATNKVIGGAQKRADRSADVEAFRAARKAADAEKTGAPQGQAIMLPTAEEAETGTGVLKTAEEIEAERAGAPTVAEETAAEKPAGEARTEEAEAEAAAETAETREAEEPDDDWAVDASEPAADGTYSPRESGRFDVRERSAAEQNGVKLADLDSSTLKFGSEAQTEGIQLRTAAETEREAEIRKAEENGNVTRATGLRYGIDEKTIRKAEQMSQMTGHRVQFYSGQARNGAVENGFTNKKTGDIFMNKNAKKAFEFVFGHEWTHNQEGTKAYQALMEHIKSRAAEQGMDWLQRRADMRALYERGTGETLTDAEIDEEIAADWIGDNLSDERSIREICRDNPSVMKRIRDALDNFLVRAGNIGGIITPYEQRKYENILGMMDRYIYIGEANENLRRQAEEAAAEAPEEFEAETETAEEETAQDRAERAEEGESSGTGKNPTSGRNAETARTGEATRASEAARGNAADRAEQLRARIEERYDAGEITDEEYDEAMALADEMESTGLGYETGAVEDEGPRGKIGEFADRVRGRKSLTPEDVRYSLSEDQREQVESPEFMSWFGDWQNDPENASKVVNPDGTPKIVYHGTARGDRVGNVFLQKRATSGPMAYFTDSEQIAANYARDKSDTSLAYEEDHDGSYESQFRVQDGDRSIRLVDAWNRLKMRDRLAIREAVKHVTWDEDMENIVYDEDAQAGTGGLQDWRFREHSGNAIAALVDEWLNDGNLYGNEGDFMEAVRLAGIPEALERAGLGEAYYDDPNFRDEKVYGVYLNIRNPLVTTELDESFADALEEWWDEQEQDAYQREYNRADEWDKNRWDVYDWIDRLRSDIENGTTHVWTSIPDAVTDFIKSEGYDGIEDQGGKFHDEGHTVYIPFESTQIKSATDNVGTFDPEDPDIRYSVSPEEDEAYLAAVRDGDMETAQRMVDETAVRAGYTLKAYHGTKSNEFYKFDEKRIGQNYGGYNASGGGFDFTNSENRAKLWGGKSKGNNDVRVIPVYLNPKKTFYSYNGAVNAELEKLLPSDMNQQERNKAMSSGRAFREAFENNNIDFKKAIESMGYFSYAMYPGDENISVYSPEQIKSADPVTYDDDGNVIPLSERFDEREPDIRRSMSEVTAEERELRDEAEERGIRFSMSYSSDREERQQDIDYIKAVLSDDENAEFQVLKDAAAKKRYTVEAYHGTKQFGFTVPDVSKSDDQISFFTTTDLGTARTYSAAEGTRDIKDYNRTDTEKAVRDAVENYKTVLETADKTGNFRYDAEIEKELEAIKDRIVQGQIESKMDKIELISDLYNVAYQFFRNYVYEIEPVSSFDIINGYEANEQEETDVAYDNWLDSEEFKPIEDAILGITNVRNGTEKGNYHVFLNVDGLLEVDGHGAQWDNIPFLTDTYIDFKSTRDIARYAKDHGYPGVHFKNIIDDGMQGEIRSGVADVYALFEPERQVRSADLVTYDDDGKIILPSKRYDSKMTDFRWSLSEAERRTDREYKVAVTMGDMEAAAQMVEKAARAAGYDTPKLYHGTPQKFGFTKFDIENMQGTIFATSDYYTAETYSGSLRRRRIYDADDFQRLSADELLRKAQENEKWEGSGRFYVRYQTMPAAEKQNFLQKIEKDYESTVQQLREYGRYNEVSWLEQDYIEEIIDVLEKAHNAADTEEWRAARDELYDLLINKQAAFWLDDHFLTDVKNIVHAPNNDDGVNLLSRLYDNMLGKKGNLYVDYGNDSLIDEEAVRKAALAPEGAGIYELYGKAGKQLVIEGNVANWNRIPAPAEFGEKSDTTMTTRQIAEKARELGYDSVLIKDITDFGPFGSDSDPLLMDPGEPSDIYLFFHAEDVKSADPVTYDDHGNLIPLSERFKPEKKDIRWSMSENEDDGGLTQKAKLAAARVERRLTDDLLQAVQSDIKKLPSDPAYRRFRAEVAHPVIEAMMRGEDADVDELLVSTGIDIVGQAAARGAAQDALRRAQGELARIGQARTESEARRAAREARNAELDARIPTDRQGLIDLGEQVKRAKKYYQGLRGRTVMTEEDLDLAHKIATGQITAEEAYAQNPFGMDDVINMAEAERAYLDASAPWERYTRRLAKERYDRADAALEDAGADTAKDKASGFRYARETPERNMRDVFSNSGGLISDYIRPIHAAEAASTRFKNAYNQRVKELGISQKRVRGNAASEAYAVQFLGEAEDNIRVLTLIGDPAAVRDGMNLTEWQTAVDEFRAANPNLDYDKVQRGIREFARIYGELIDLMNGVLVENGYLPVNTRRGYFPHFTAGTDGVLATFAHLLGIKIENQALPTAINGLTDRFKPGKPWFSHSQERTGFRTDYDALQGFDGYLKGVSDVIHQTPNIRNLRALATRIRYRFGDEGIRKRINEIETNEGMTDEEKLAAISDLTANGKYKLSRFVSWLDEYTNLLANKKSKYDRGIEDLVGRRVYNWMKNVEGRVAANMIAGNLGSALTNFIPLNQAHAVLGNTAMLRGAFDTMAGRARHDGFVERSDFLTNRRGVDPLIRGGMEKFADFLSKPMNLIDDFTSETIVRAAYAKNIKAGMDPQSAMEAADELAAGLMADRSKGALPTIFGSSNPLTKLFTQFQVEVNNEFSTIFKDIPKGVFRRDEDKKQAVAAVAWTLLRYFLGAYLFNDLYEKIVGRRAALDPVDLLNDAVGDATGYKLNNVFDMLSEGVIEDAGRANPSDAIMNFAANAAEELPFVGGLLGGGRIPISSALPDMEKIVKGLANENWSGAKKAETVGRELGKSIGTYILPPFAGGLGKKLWQTGENAIRGGRYVKDASGEEQLQYPYYMDNPLESAVTIAQSALFGPTGTEGGREWVENDFNTLSAKKTKVYEMLQDDFGEDRRTSYDLITTFYKVLPTYDADGNGTIKQSEVTDALEGMTVPLTDGEGALQGLFGGSMEERPLTREEKAVLWQSYNKAWKPEKNPFDPKIGAEVFRRLNGGNEEE